MNERNEHETSTDSGGRVEPVVSVLVANGWKEQKDRPEDGQRVEYLFEPFMKFYVGIYDEESDSVCGESGFTTWVHEVISWRPAH